MISSRDALKADDVAVRKAYSWIEGNLSPYDNFTWRFGYVLAKLELI